MARRSRKKGTHRQPGDTDHDKSGGKGRAQQPTPQSAEQKARAARAGQALKQQMDRALARQRAKPAKGPHQLGVLEADDPQSKLPAELRQALQRVPDDPGALLRRKFEIEYRQRHHRLTFGGEQP